MSTHALITAHASILTTDTPHGLVVALLALVLLAYAACGMTTLGAAARRRRTRRRIAHRVLTASRQKAGHRADERTGQHAEVTS